MEREHAEAVVRRALGRIAPDIDAHAVNPDEDLRVGCDLDSMDFLALAEQVSAGADIVIADSDDDQLVSINDFVDALTGS